jgi:hypothetical protein
MRRRVARILLGFILLLLPSCSEFLDVAVTNPCGKSGIVVIWSFKTAPTPADARRALTDDQSADNRVPANVRAFVIQQEIPGDLPYRGGYGLLQWDGDEEYDTFRIQPSDIDPVPVEVPAVFCG